MAGAALGAASLGAAVNIGTAIYNDEKGFSARHEQCYDSQSALTQRLAEAFAKARKEGDLDEESQELYLRLKEDAVQAAKSYHKSISEYKGTASYNLPRKLEAKKKVRKHKRRLRNRNEELQSHYNSSLSGDESDASSFMATSGSPPGSGLEDEGIREWTYNILTNDRPQSPSPSANVDANLSDEEDTRQVEDDGPPPSYFNATPILCSTCDSHIPHWYFKKHRDFCITIRVLADGITACNDEISDFDNTIIGLRRIINSPILDQIHDLLRTVLDTGICRTSREEHTNPAQLWQDLAKLVLMDGIPEVLQWTGPEAEDAILKQLVENADRIAGRKMECIVRMRGSLRHSKLPWDTWQKHPQAQAGLPVIHESQDGLLGNETSNDSAPRLDYSDTVLSVKFAQSPRAGFQPLHDEGTTLSPNDQSNSDSVPTHPVKDLLASEKLTHDNVLSDIVRKAARDVDQLMNAKDSRVPTGQSLKEQLPYEVLMVMLVTLLLVLGSR